MHAILAWYDRQGRKSFPWQHKPNAYKVWLSEIMLQQTQVATVIPYFQRFIHAFPNLRQLAKANEDQVLALWSGLGYYSRARNLFACAQIIHQQYAGRFPRDLSTLESLPGIGRSTAGAILATAFHIRAPILDGNVKRVLTRLHAITGWPEKSEVKKQLWEIAEYYTPELHVANYTQAIMDLGALVCTRSKPDCASCPLQSHCSAYAQGKQLDYPSKKLKKKIPLREKKFLLLVNQQGQIYLEKRPSSGIWGGLWCLPECEMPVVDLAKWSKQQYGFVVSDINIWEKFRHTFTHFHLDISPYLLRVKKSSQRVQESAQGTWYDLTHAQSLGLATPITRLLKKLVEEQ